MSWGGPGGRKSLPSRFREGGRGSRGGRGGRGGKGGRGGDNNNPTGQNGNPQVGGDNSNAVGGDNEGLSRLRGHAGDLLDDDDDDDYSRPSRSIQPFGSSNHNLFGDDVANPFSSGNHPSRSVTANPSAGYDFPNLGPPRGYAASHFGQPRDEPDEDEPDEIEEEDSIHDPTSADRRGAPYHTNSRPQRRGTKRGGRSSGLGRARGGTGSRGTSSGLQRTVKKSRRAPYAREKQVKGNINLYSTPDNLGEFIDDSPRKANEPESTARIRINSARRNMGIEPSPRPPPPAEPPLGARREQYRRDLNQWYRDMTILRDRHNNMRNPTNQQYNAEYVHAYNREKIARQTRNRIRRETALERMRTRYAAAGMPRPDTPPPAADSSDEEDRWGGQPRSAAVRASAVAADSGPDSHLLRRVQCEECRRQHKKCDWEAKYATGERCSNCCKADKNIDCKVHYRGGERGLAHTTKAASASNNLPKSKRPAFFRKIGLPNSSLQPPAFPPEAQPDTFTPCDRCLENPHMRICTASRPCGPCILWNERDKCNQPGDGGGNLATANVGFSSGPSRQIAALAAPRVPRQAGALDPALRYNSHVGYINPYANSDLNPNLDPNQNQYQYQPHIQNSNQFVDPNELPQFIDPLLLQMQQEQLQNQNQYQAQDQGQGNRPRTREEVFGEANISFAPGPSIRASELPIPRNPFLRANTNAEDPQRPFNSILPVTHTLNNGSRGNAAEELQNTNLSEWQPQPTYPSAGPLDDPHAPQDESIDQDMDDILASEDNLNTLFDDLTNFELGFGSPLPRRPDWMTEDPLRLYAMPIGFQGGVYTWWNPYIGLDPAEACTELTSDSLEPELVQCFKRPAKKCDASLAGHPIDPTDTYICNDCHMSQISFADKQEQATNSCKWYYCGDCANITRANPVDTANNHLASYCRCTGQLRKLWLCRQHREEGIQAVVCKVALSQASLLQNFNGTMLCPGCKTLESDPQSGVWQCYSCDSDVLERP